MNKYSNNNYKKSAPRVIITLILAIAFIQGGTSAAYATELDPFRASGERKGYIDGFYTEDYDFYIYNREHKKEILEVIPRGYLESGGLAFSVRGADSRELDRILVDLEPIQRKDCAVVGHLTVILKPEFLKNLSPGVHAIELQFRDKTGIKVFITG